MTTTRVARYPADKKGPDVVDPLLSTEEVRRARGLREVDFYCSNRRNENGNCILMDYMANGSLINVTENTGPYRGKLKLFSIIIDISENDFTCSSAVVVEKVME